MADDAYQKRIQELQKYVPFLENTIKRLKSETGRLREAQISKLQSLLVILTDPKKKLKLDALRKCEEVILKLYEKVEKKPPENKMQKHMCRNPPDDKFFGGPETLSPLDNATFSAARQKLCKVEVEMTPASPSPPPVPPSIAQPVVIPTEKVNECSSDRVVFNNPPPPLNNTRPSNTLNWPNNAFNSNFQLETRNQVWKNEELFVRRNEIPNTDKKFGVWSSTVVTVNKKPPPIREMIDYSDTFDDTSEIENLIPIPVPPPPKILPVQTRVKSDRIVQEYLEEQRMKQLLKSPSPPKLNKPPLSESDLQDLLSSAPTSREHSPLLNEDMDLDKLEELKAKLCKELAENPDKDPLKVSKPFPVMAPKPKLQTPKVVKEKSNIFGDLLSSIDEQIMNKKDAKNKTVPIKKEVKPKEEKKSPEIKVKTEKTDIPKEKNNSKDSKVDKSKSKDSKTKEDCNKTKDKDVKKEDLKSKDVKKEDVKSKDKDIKKEDAKSKDKDVKKEDAKSKDKDVKKEDAKSKDKDVKKDDEKTKDKEAKKEDLKTKKEVKKEEAKTKDKDAKVKETEKSKPVDSKSRETEVKPKESESKTKKDPKHIEEPKIKTEPKETKVKTEVKSKEDLKKDGPKQNETKKEVKPVKPKQEKSDKARRTSTSKEKSEEKSKTEKDKTAKELPKFIYPLDQIMKELDDSMKDKMPQTEEEKPTTRLSDKYPHKRKPSTETSLTNLLDEPKIIPLSPTQISPKKPLSTEVHPVKLHDPRLRSGPFSPPLEKNPPVCQNLFPEPPMPFSPVDPYMGNRTPIDPFSMGNRTPMDPFAGNMTPVDPFAGNMTPSDPFAGARTPVDPFSGCRTPVDPFNMGNRTPGDPFASNCDVDMRAPPFRNNFNPNQNQFRPNMPNQDNFRPPVDQFRPNPEQFRQGPDFRPNQKQFRHKGDQFRNNQEGFRPGLDQVRQQCRPNRDNRQNQNQIRPLIPPLIPEFNNQNHFRPNKDQFRHGDNFRPNKDQFRPNKNKFRQHEDQFRHKFNPRIPNPGPPRQEFQQNSQNFNPYDLSQVNPIDFYENENQNERRNPENFHTQRRENRVQKVNPIIRPREERRSRFQDFPKEEPDNRRPPPQIEPRREDPRKKKEDPPKEPTPTPEAEPKIKEAKEDVCSPLDSLYSSLNKPIVGKGYGIQNFRIPKKKKPEIKEEKKDEIKEEEIQTIEDDKTEIEEPKETQNEDIKEEEVRKEEIVEANTSKEAEVPPKSEADEKLDMFNKFMKHIFETCDSSFLLQYLDKCGISIPKSKTKRIRRIINSDSESEEEEPKEETKKEVEKPEPDITVEEPLVKEVPEPKTPETVPVETEPETDQDLKDIVTETVGERIKNRRRKPLIYSSDSSPEKLSIATSEESSSTNLLEEKKPTRKSTRIPKTKRKNALELLQEDLRDMFISEGVLTATGKRMCRMMKEHQEQEQEMLNTPETGVVTDGTMSEDDIPLSIKCKNYKNKKKETIKKEGPVDEVKKEELPQRKLRSSPRVLLEKINFPALKFSDEETSADEKDEKDKKEEVTFAEPVVPTKTKKKKRASRRGKGSRKRYRQRLNSGISSSSTIDSIIESVVSSTGDLETDGTETTETLDSTDLETTESEAKPQGKKLRKRRSRTQTIDSETTTTTADTESQIDLETVEPETVVDNEDKPENKRPVRKRNAPKIFEFEDPEPEPEIEPENKRPARKRSSTKVLEFEDPEPEPEIEPEDKRPVKKIKKTESENEESTELDTAELEEKPEKKKQIKKKRNNWAHGYIQKSKRKTKTPKQDRSNSSLSMNTEISDQMSVTESLLDESEITETEPELPVVEPEVPTVEPETESVETESQFDEEFALLKVDIKPDVNYYFNYANKTKCKLCEYVGRYIVHHYRSKHPESEILISRLHPDIAEQALNESMEHKFEDIIPYDELCNGGKKRRNYVCRFCDAVLKKETVLGFVDHLCCHTGEYRYGCDICSFVTGTKKTLSAHCYSNHPELKKPLNLQATWPCPPNFRIVFGYMCKDCNFTQILRKNVEKHVRVSHLDRNVEIVKISLSSKPVSLYNLKSPKELEEAQEKTDEVEEPEPVKEKEPEPEPVKEKEPDMTAFLEPDDISLHDQKIEEERRKKMAEIASNITPRRSTLQFIDQLKNKLKNIQSEPEPIDCPPIDFESHPIKTLNEDVPPEDTPSEDFSLKISSTISLAETETEPESDNAIMIASTISLAELESRESENSQSSEITEVPNPEDEEIHISEDEEMDISNVELDIATDSKQKGVMNTIQRLAAKLQTPKIPETVSIEDIEDSSESEQNTEPEEVKMDEIQEDNKEIKLDDKTEQLEQLEQQEQEESPDVQKVISVGAIEVRIKNKEQVYVCKIQDCNFRSSYKITFTKHCSEAHSVTVLCEICARENTFVYFTMTSLFVHLFDAHKSNAKTVPSAKIRIRRISGDLLSNKPDLDPMAEISEPVIETIEVNQEQSEPIGFLQIKDVRTLTEEEEHILQPKKSPVQKKNSLSNFTTVKIAPNLSIIKSMDAQTPLPNLQVSPDLKLVQQVKKPPENPQNLKQVTTISGISTAAGRKMVQTKKIMIPIHELPKYVSLKQAVPQKKQEPSPNLCLRKNKKVFNEMIALPKILDLYKCSVENCSYSTNAQKDFRIHMITHKWCQVIICVYCQQGIIYNNLISHIEAVHGHCTLQCAFCFYRSVSKVYLFDHQKHVHKHNNDVLMDAFFYDLKPKITTVYQPPPTNGVVLPYRCTQDNCDQKFLIADDFMVHLHVTHKKYFTCGICDDRAVYFVTALALIQHYVIHDIARYQCQYCKYGTHSMDSMFTHYARRHSHLGPVCYIRQPKNKNVKSLPESAADLVTIHMELKRPVETTSATSTSDETTSDQSQNFSSPTITTTIPDDTNENIQSEEIPIADVDVAGVPQNGDKDNEIIDLDAGENDAQFSEPYVILKHRNAESKNAVENAVDPLLVDDSDENDNADSELVEVKPDILHIQPDVEELPETVVQPEFVNLTDDFYICAGKNCTFSSDTMNEFRNHLVICDIMTNCHSCYYCKVKFKNVQALCDHIQMHREERFFCGLCECKDKFKSLIIQHLKEIHKVNKHTLKPIDPQKTDIKKDHFILNPSEDVEQTEPESNEQIITIPSLAELFGDVDDSRFTCDICQFKTQDPNPVLQHMKDVHQVHYTQFYPVDKNKKDLTKDLFLVKAVNSPEDDILISKPKHVFGPEDIDSLPRQPVYKSEIKCKLCNYNTKVRSNMQRHLQQHIEEKAVSESAPVNPVPCLEKNEKMFDKMTNLAASSHYGRMGGKPVEKNDKGQDENNMYPGFIPVSKRFVCGAQNCNYLTHGDQMLRHHLTALHGDEMIYKCPHCHIDIPSEIDGLEIDQILFHLKMHDLHLYKCPNCEFFHYQKHKLERHISDNHQDEDKNIVVIRELDNSANLDDDRPTLPVSFIEQIANAEANEFKPWRCGYCNFKCQARNEVINHTNIQHGVKSQFKCAKCKFRCSAKSNFTSHFKKLHPESSEPEIETVYYKITEEEDTPQEETSEPSPSQPEFDTTPLWMKNKTGVKHIRGILLEETKSSAKRTPKIIEKLQEIKSNLGEGTSKMEDTIAKIENVSRNLFPEPQKAPEKIFEFPTSYGNSHENFYVCPSCDSFKTRSVKEFMEHLYAEMNYYRCSCSLCGQQFVDILIAKHHWASYHHTQSTEEQLNVLTPDTKVENWVEQCISHQTKTLKTDDVDTISENTSEASSLDIDASPSKLKCEFCDFSAKNMKTLRKHQKRHEDYCPFKCDYCDFKALTVRSIKNHHRIKHKFEELSYTVVPTQLEKNISLKRKRDESDDKLNPTKIVAQDESEQVLIEPDMLTLDDDPETILEGDMQISYICLHCPRKSEDLATIRKHFFDFHAKYGTFKYKKVNIDKSKKTHYKCNFCDWFGDPNSLKYHCLQDHNEQIWIPQRNTKLKCSICSLVYSKLQPLKKHFTVKHCGKNVSFFTLLEDGMILDSTEFIEEKDVPVNCSYCADQFENKEQLFNHHTLLHSHLEFEKDSAESKKYKCGECEETSNSYKSMKLHLLKHGTPYNCNLCSFVCFLPSRLKSHHMKVHPEEPYTYVVDNSIDSKTQRREKMSQLMLYLNSNGTYSAKNKLKRPNNATDVDEPPNKILVIDDEPIKRNVAKKSTTLPAVPKNVAKKSTANRPKSMEYSYYGTKPCNLNNYKTVMSEINIMGKVMPINVVAMSHVLNLCPIVSVVDIKKAC